MQPFPDSDNDEKYVKSDIAYELWKARELKRILREREERATADEERKEVERRRNLTEVEREAENMREGIHQKK